MDNSVYANNRESHSPQFWKSFSGTVGQQTTPPTTPLSSQHTNPNRSSSNRNPNSDTTSHLTNPPAAYWKPFSDTIGHQMDPPTTHLSKDPNQFSSPAAPIRQITNPSSIRRKLVRPRKPVRSNTLFVRPNTPYSSEQRKTRAISALKIQKVFRGIAGRKNVKKLVRIETQLDEIQQRIVYKESQSLIARGSNERSKVFEMLMNLLIQLDSVRSAPGVGEFRNALTDKADMLLGRVDLGYPIDYNDDERTYISEYEMNNDCSDQNDSWMVEDNEEEIGESDEVNKPILSREEVLEMMVSDLGNKMEKLIEHNGELTALVTGMCESQSVHMEFITSLRKRLDRLENKVKWMS